MLLNWTLPNCKLQKIIYEDKLAINMHLLQSICIFLYIVFMTDKIFYEILTMSCVLRMIIHLLIVLGNKTDYKSGNNQEFTIISSKN